MADLTVDIVELVVRDHRRIEDMLARFAAEPRDKWGQTFHELTNLLVRHEVAEEEVVYPSLRRASIDTRGVVHARLAEQAESEALMAKLEKLDATSDEFARAFATFKAGVLSHAQREEETVLVLLRQLEDTEQRNAVAGLYERALATAPTHPHPHAPDTPPGNLLLGPVAALVDRVRDAIRSVSPASK